MLDEFRETAITWDKASRKVYEPLRVSGGDNKGRKLSVQVVNGGVIENLSGASLSLFWETKDKAHKGLDAFTAVDATRGEFEIYYTTGMLSNEGVLNANLVLADANGRIVSEPFTITVFKGIDDDAIQSSDSFTALTEALVQVGTINNKADRAELLALESTFEQNKVSVEQQLHHKADKSQIGAPLSASSVAEMIDKTRVYVNTTDGKWYSWNGTDWIAGGTYNSQGVGEKTITPEKTSFINLSSNLYNQNDISLGYTLNNNDGKLEANLNFAAGGKVLAKPASKYRIRNIVKIMMYNAWDTLVGSYSPSSYDYTTMTTHSSTAYIRAVTFYNDYTKAQINEGEANLPYEPYYQKLIDSILIDESAIIKNETPPTENSDDYFVLGMDTNEKYTQTGLTGGLQYTRGEQLSRYVSLRQEFPSYITEHVHGKDDFNNDLVYYNFKPTPVTYQSVTTKFPKMILISGVHGEERAGVYNLFNALNAIARNWKTNPSLEMLRWNVEIIVIPIANPSGYDASSRKNGNGVDIARNFPVGFSVTKPDSATYGGPAALSEKESQFIKTIIDENSDAIYVGSFHNMWSSTSFIWNASATRFQVQLGKQLISMQTQKWKKEHTWMPQDDNFYVGYADMNSPQGSESLYAASLGIESSTFETSASVGFNDGDKGAFSTTSANLGAETIVNWLGLILKENVKFYNALQ